MCLNVVERQCYPERVVTRLPEGEENGPFAEACAASIVWQTWNLSK